MAKYSLGSVDGDTIRESLEFKPTSIPEFGEEHVQMVKAEILHYEKGTIIQATLSNGTTAKYDLICCQKFDMKANLIRLHMKEMETGKLCYIDLRMGA